MDNEPYKETIIETLRLGLGISARECAYKCKIAPATFYRVEKGYAIKHYNQVKIANYFNVDVGELFKKDGRPKYGIQ